MGIRGKRNNSLVVYFAVCTALLFCLVGQPSAFATETSVDAIVCNPSDRIATLTIVTPTADTVIEGMPITVEGEIRNISQVEVYVNDKYSFTESFSSESTEFNLELSLEQGTHEVLLRGIDICNYDDITDSVVVTHQPPFEQSELMPDVATNSGNNLQGVTAPDVITGTHSGEFSEGEGLAALEAVPILGPIIRGGARAVDASGLSAPFASGTLRGLTSTTAVITGLVLITNASVLTNGIHLRKWSFMRSFKLPQILQEPSRAAVMLRIIGFILLAAVYLL